MQLQELDPLTPKQLGAEEWQQQGSYNTGTRRRLVVQAGPAGCHMCLAATEPQGAQ